MDLEYTALKNDQNSCIVQQGRAKKEKEKRKRNVLAKRYTFASTFTFLIKIIF